MSEIYFQHPVLQDSSLIMAFVLYFLMEILMNRRKKDNGVKVFGTMIVRKAVKPHLEREREFNHYSLDGKMKMK